MRDATRVFDCDPRKREWLVRERDLDPLDMSEVFDDEQRLEDVDRRFDYGEERRITIGRARGKVFTVVFTQRGSLTWLGPLLERNANAMGNAELANFARLEDGTWMQRQSDGSFQPTEAKTNDARLAALTDDEIEAMAASDPDHPPLDDAFWADVDARAAAAPPIAVELDADVASFFRLQGADVRSEINRVLRGFIAARTVDKV